MEDIVVIFDPVIDLDVISIKDVEFGTEPTYEPTGDEVKYSKLVGDYSPFVQINGMKFSGDQIDFMDLDCSGFLPILRIAIKEKGGLFTSKSFPRDGDLVNVYIKSNNKDFKPIRNDYRILDVSAPVSDDELGEQNTFSITGILNIPDMFVDKAVSFKNSTSLDVLQEIARELGLGFATNETSMDDSMTRICPYTPYYDWITGELIPSAYKDDDSFYVAYVDQYYYLTLVNINYMITLDRELDQQKIHILGSSDSMPDDKEIEQVLSDLFLSNSKFVWNSPNQIVGYAPINDSGNVSLQNGYRTYLQYYNKDDRDTSQYFIETLNTESVQDKIILKGRDDFDHTKQIKIVNAGWQFDSNVHSNYLHAMLQNKYNGDEMEKLKLSMELATINPNVYKYQSIPVYIVNNRNNEIRKQATQEEDDPDKQSIDRFLSGWYVIQGMTYKYSERRFTESLVLIKREWDLPK